MSPDALHDTLWRLTYLRQTLIMDYKSKAITCLRLETDLIALIVLHMPLSAYVVYIYEAKTQAIFHSAHFKVISTQQKTFIHDEMYHKTSQMAKFLNWEIRLLNLDFFS